MEPTLTLLEYKPYDKQGNNFCQYRQFKYIEIVDEKTVKEHLSFVHQYYE
jgi:hypothetical protein